MRYILFSLLLLGFTATRAQVTVQEGNSQTLKVISQPSFSSFSTTQKDYFLWRKPGDLEKITTMIVADKAGNIGEPKQIFLPAGVINNMNDLNAITVVNNQLVAFVENHNKATGKNSMGIRTIDNEGVVSKTDIPVGDFAFTKMINPGNWYVSVTPDKKHVAVVGQAAHEKDKPDQFVYFFLDENFKPLKSGQLSFPGYTKRVPIFDFLASDKGDLYLIAEEYDKTYKYPVLFKATAGATEMAIIPVQITDPNLKNTNYTSALNEQGELVMAGYIQERKTVGVGYTKAVGAWTFNSSRPQEVKINPLDKPMENLTARNILVNGNTWFLVGEQYRTESVAPTNQQVLARESNNIYHHEDMLVAGFDAAGNKKFEMPLSRKFSGRNFDQDLMAAQAILNGKLTLIYHDDVKKHLGGTGYGYSKIPIMVTITNDGLMEAPVHFAKELKISSNPFNLFPQFVSASKDRIVILEGDGEKVKAVTFK